MTRTAAVLVEQVGRVAPLGSFRNISQPLFRLAGADGANVAPRGRFRDPVMLGMVGHDAARARCGLVGKAGAQRRSTRSRLSSFAARATAPSDRGSLRPVGECVPLCERLTHSLELPARLVWERE